MSATARADGTIRLHRLTMVTENDGVMIGRTDISSYALFPAEGAQALRLLDAGTPIADVAAWYRQTCGTALDVDDFLAVLDDLKFVRGDGEVWRPRHLFAGNGSGGGCSPGLRWPATPR